MNFCGKQTKSGLFTDTAYTKCYNIRITVHECKAYLTSTTTAQSLYD